MIKQLFMIYVSCRLALCPYHFVSSFCKSITQGFEIRTRVTTPCKTVDRIIIYIAENKLRPKTEMCLCKPPLFFLRPQI